MDSYQFAVKSRTTYHNGRATLSKDIITKAYELGYVLLNADTCTFVEESTYKKVQRELQKWIDDQSTPVPEHINFMPLANYRGHILAIKKLQGDIDYYIDGKMKTQHIHPYTNFIE